jgi:hypothetical protein
LLAGRPSCSQISYARAAIFWYMSIMSSPRFFAQTQCSSFRSPRATSSIYCSNHILHQRNESAHPYNPKWHPCNSIETIHSILCSSSRSSTCHPIRDLKK